tara:strand:+ start:1145 stop:2125 length:981 start_codon:yes stop_codon:yes gene_type:complete
MKNLFFIPEKNISLFKILDLLKIDKNKFKDTNVKNIKPLESCTKEDITFLNNSRYLNELNNKKFKFLIIQKKNIKYFNNNKKLLIVNNVLQSVYKIVNLFYPNNTTDIVDLNLKAINERKIYQKLQIGKNILVGNKVKIGANTTIGNNTIIESNVIIGKNCCIGSNVVVKNSLIGDNVVIQDGAIIGKSGFGFSPNLNKNIYYPHVGMVIVNDNVQIGCNNTIDRGSLSNTIIGKNTFLDNQVHIAHNVKIGKNCIIAGQVGIAGSTILGNQVHIGGQAGISGHLNIGSNVKIAGGSGVIKDIPSNKNVMGYPAKDIKQFLRENNK